MPEIFANGLSLAQNDEIDNITIDLRRLYVRIEELGRHRSLSLAQTKIEEAAHWLSDRKHKTA